MAFAQTFLQLLHAIMILVGGGVIAIVAFALIVEGRSVVLDVRDWFVDRRRRGYDTIYDELMDQRRYRKFQEDAYLRQIRRDANDTNTLMTAQEFYNGTA